MNCPFNIPDDRMVYADFGCWRGNGELTGTPRQIGIQKRQTDCNQ